MEEKGPGNKCVAQAPAWGIGKGTDFPEPKENPSGARKPSCRWERGPAHHTASSPWGWLNPAALSPGSKTGSHSCRRLTLLRSTFFHGPTGHKQQNTVRTEHWHRAQWDTGTMDDLTGSRRLSLCWGFFSLQGRLPHSPSSTFLQLHSLLLLELSGEPLTPTREERRCV